MLLLFYFLYFSFKSYNVCAVNPSSWLLDTSIMPNGISTFWSEAFFHVGRTNWTPYKQVKRAKKWDNFVTETAIEEDWRQNVRMIRRSLYKLANELRLNPDTCRILVEGQFRVELLYGYVWTWKFLNQQGKICGFKTIRGPLSILQCFDCHLNM